MNLKYCVFFLFFLAITSGLKAAGPAETTDSLARMLNQATDTTRINLLLQLTDEVGTADPRQAFMYGQEALRLAREGKYSQWSGRACEAVARVYTNSGIYDKALEYLLDGLKEYESASDTAGMAKCQDEAGYVYLLSGDFTNARDHFNDAVKLNKRVRNYRQIAYNYLHAGMNYVQHDSVEKGLSYFTVALLLADSLGLETDQVELLNSIGYGYARLGKHEDALRHFYKVLELVGRQPDDLNRSVAMINLARGYIGMNNYPAATKYANEGYILAKSKHFIAVQRDAARILSDIAEGQDDFRLAYRYFREYTLLSDSIINSEKSGQLARIRTLFELDKKEQENASLRAENSESIKLLRTRNLLILSITFVVLVLVFALFFLNRLNNKQLALNRKLAEQGKELQSLNDQKDRFFSFVAHNLKNPFNTIMGFSELMQRTTDARDVEKARQYSALIYDLSTQVQKVLSNLLEWSRLQRRTFECRPETFELNSLAKDVLEMNTREAARKDIHCSISGNDNLYVTADRSMITTVLQNLVSNALSFTPASGKVSVTCSTDGQQATVSIADTGVGISSENMERLFRFDFSHNRIGPADKSGAGLGLIISQEMIMKNNGTISAESVPGKGSQFIFTLPLVHREVEIKPESEAILTESDVTRSLVDSSHQVPPDTVNEIMMNLAPLYKEVSEVLSIDTLEDFAGKVVNIGGEKNQPALSDYGLLLQRFIKSHQIDLIIKVMPAFKTYLDNLMK
jgi:signal transduction histidine kinase